MKYLCVALCWVLTFGAAAAAASGKETCSETWNRGNYKTFRQIQDELQHLGNGKILRISLCGAANDHYFQVTVLYPFGKVRILHLAAH